jgi:hypothetical protein
LLSDGSCFATANLSHFQWRRVIYLASAALLGIVLTVILASPRGDGSELQPHPKKEVRAVPAVSHGVHVTLSCMHLAANKIGGWKARTATA